MIESMPDVRDLGSEPKLFMSGDLLEPIHKVSEKNGFDNDVKNIIPEIKDDIYEVRIKNVEDKIYTLIEKIDMVGYRLDTLNEKIDEKNKIGFGDVMKTFLYVTAALVGGALVGILKQG